MKKFENDDYKFIHEPSGLRVSPDGKHAVYTVRNFDVAGDKYVNHIWLADVENESVLQLTQGDGEWAPKWLDNSRVLFSARRGAQGPDKTTVYVISINGGEASAYVTVPLCGAELYPAVGGRFIVFADHDIASSEEKEEEKWMTFDEYPFEGDGRGHDNRHRRAMYLWEGEGSKPLQLTSDTMQTMPMMFSESVAVTETSVFFAGADYDKDLDGMCGIYRFDFADGKIAELFKERCYIYALCLKEGRLYFNHYSMKPHDTFNSRLWSVSTEGGDTRQEVNEEWQIASMNCAFDKLLFVKDYQSCGSVCELCEDGSIKEYKTEGLSVTGLAALPGGRTLFIARRKDTLPDVYLMHADGSIARLSHHFDELEGKFTFSENEPLAVENEGYTIHGWVMKPVNYDPNKKYPGILNMHGGPHGNYTDAFVYEHQRWANEGYFVFFCNPRGSTSYGPEFADISGDMGGKDYRDIMAFTDAVLKAYPALDEKRLAVTGQSYGGYMSNRIIGLTDRFAAASPRMAISNWTSMYGSSMEKWYAAACLDADIWSDFEKVWAQSPLKYADRVKTPTLFIQHETDRCCPLGQAEQIFVKLLENGVPARLVVNKNAGHGGRRISQLHHDIDVMLAWFAEYLKPEVLK